MLHLLNPFREPTPLQMLAKQLEQAQRDRITSEAQAEAHRANVQMLNARIARIKREIQAMNETQGETPQ